MRRVPVVSLVVAVSIGIASPVAQGQENAKGQAERYQKLLEQHKGDFDYLLGNWSFTARNSEHGPFTGVWSAVRLATGSGANVLDEYRVTGENGETYFASSTLRVYNPAIDTWELVSVHETSGLQDRGTAQKVGDEMRLEQTFGVTRGKPEAWRIRYFDIRADAFHWAADRSLDGGKTWERDYMTLSARRTGPARTLEPLARATPR